mgnify:CR=1 FL=1
MRREKVEIENREQRERHFLITMRMPLHFVKEHEMQI